MWKIKETNLKTSEILKELRKYFPVYFYREGTCDYEFPAPKKLTTRSFKENVEADPDLANKSADELKQEEQITLRERLLLELQYFKETDKHLDIENITLCAGSRYSDGFVPCVNWGDDKLYVYWYYSHDRGDGLRSRQAVSGSLKPSSLVPSVPESLELVVGKKKYTYELKKI